MKKLFVYACVFGGILFSLSSECRCEKVINRLSSMEVSVGAYENHPLSTKILFKCIKPLTFCETKTQETKTDDGFRFAFPGFSENDFKRLKIEDRLSRLKIIKKVSVKYESPCVVVRLNFQKGSIRLISFRPEGEAILVLEIFSRESLRKLQDKPDTLSWACNSKRFFLGKKKILFQGVRRTS